MVEIDGHKKVTCDLDLFSMVTKKVPSWFWPECDLEPKFQYDRYGGSSKFEDFDKKTSFFKIDFTRLFHCLRWWVFWAAFARL